MKKNIKMKCNIGISFFVPRGEVKVAFLRKDDNTYIGNVIICEYEDYIEVIYIYVAKKYRGNGFAKLLIKTLQSKYDYIITGWEDSSEEGKDLFLKMGFKLKVPLKKGLLKSLEWKKK